LYCNGTTWIDPATGGASSDWVTAGTKTYLSNSTGFVGIGTNNPTSSLTVYHSTSATTNYQTSITGTNANDGLYVGVGFAGKSSIFNYENTDMNFATNASVRMTIDADGNVGIGTSTPSQRLHVIGVITGTVKAFTIDHPLDPENKILRHFSIESPEMQNFYNGNATTDANGKAIIILPDYFEALNTSPRYQLTTIGSASQAYISKKIEKNQFEITTTLPNVEVSWEVKGIRNDAWVRNENTMKTEEMKPTELRGKYFNPKAFNKPESMGMNVSSKSSNEKSSIDK
jgi:hypothetical protein